jgi:mersacidin/lichenicidin family type 2 lantibiotic
MATVDIVRAWKDCAYRDTLSEEERLALPAHPAGARRLEGDEWDAATGGMAGISHELLTMGCCRGFTESPGFCSWFCGSALADTTYGCCTPNR